ncbi:MAG: hypothetical protein IKJ61_07495 [Bacteroidaceae bacterium]|nr:hypothetical protein [Bacteroidaceae bacterium]
MKRFLLSILCLFCVAGISAQTNIASNPGFENWEGEVAVDWAGPIGHNATVSQSTDARTGNYSIAVAGNAKSNKRLASKSYTLAAGTYTFSVHVKANGTEVGHCRLGYVPVVDGKAGTYTYESASASATTAEWTERVYEFTLAEETTIALIVMNNKNGGGDSFLVDDVTLTNGEATEGGEGEGGDENEGETDVTYKTIAEVLAAGAGEAATKGTVVATYARGFLMSDATGSILVYLGSDKGYAAGDAVTVSGTTSVYGGLLQFGNTAVVEKTGTATVEHPAATAMDGAAMDAYLAAPAIQYVEYTGTLTISDKGYYNVAVDGAATAVGSIQYPQDAIKANLTSGSVVKVTGYTIGTSSSKYVNTMAVKVETVDNGGEGEGEGEGEGGEDEELEVTDISDIIAAGEGKAKAQGTIMATYARGFLLDDGTGSILVYLGSDGGNAVGEIVTVEGTTSMYGGFLQFAAGSVVTTLTTTTVSYPAATAMDGAAMDAYLAAPAIQYVEYTGTLTISDKGYYNVAVDGAATAIGSIQYPQDAIKAGLTSGSVVKVTGYTIGVSSSKYVNTMAVKVETVGEGGGEPEEPEVPTETQEYTVTEALAAYVDGKQIPAIVTGYIVGAVKSAPEKDSQFGPDATDAAVATNILISDNAETLDYTECLIVQLPSGDIRSALNLVDNPGNYKKQVKITGSVEKYFRVAGLKSVTAYEFTGTTGIEKVEIRNEKSEIYDLTGRRVENITAPGIYIVGGKKVLVK